MFPAPERHEWGVGGDMPGGLIFMAFKYTVPVAAYLMLTVSQVCIMLKAYTPLLYLTSSAHYLHAVFS